MRPSVMLRDVIDVTSGGARGRSGPAPDPNALRRDRAGDAAWTVLPAEGFKGDAPAFPLADELGAEVDLWVSLWRKPQAFMWSKLGLELEVAAYVRAFLKAVDIDASPNLMVPVLRMSAEIGLSLPGMHSLRWKFSEDELSVKRAAAVPARSGPSAKERLAALANGA